MFVFSIVVWVELVQVIIVFELCGQFVVQEISVDMYGFDLKEKEFFKVDLWEVNFSGMDLCGVVINIL